MLAWVRFRHSEEWYSMFRPDFRRGLPPMLASQNNVLSAKLQ